jgi:hypothetical protein
LLDVFLDDAANGPQGALWPKKFFALRLAMIRVRMTPAARCQDAEGQRQVQGRHGNQRKSKVNRLAES